METYNNTVQTYIQTYMHTTVNDNIILISDKSKVISHSWVYGIQKKITTRQKNVGYDWGGGGGWRNDYGLVILS